MCSKLPSIHGDCVVFLRVAAVYSVQSYCVVVRSAFRKTGWAMF